MLFFRASSAVLFVIALGLFLVSYLFGVELPASIAADYERTRAMPEIRDLAGLEVVPPGVRVVLSGRVDPAMPARAFNIFVDKPDQKYETFHFALYMTRDDETARERVTPPFRLELADGPATVANDDYWLGVAAPIQLTDEWEFVTGVAPGESVRVVGTVERAADGPRFRAEQVTNLSVEQLRSPRPPSDPNGFFWAMKMLPLLGGLILLGASIVLLLIARLLSSASGAPQLTLPPRP